MFNQYFGNYLLNRGLISREVLYRALENQQAAHLKLGVLAINANLLTAEQVEDIHAEQLRQDKRFGEIGIEKGYLNEAQLASLLAAQKEGHLLLSQALVDDGALTLAQLATALRDYQRENSLTDEELTAVQRGDLELLLAKTLAPGGPNAAAINSYLTLLAKNIIRFIDIQGWLEARDDGQAPGEWSVVQEMTGPFALGTGLAGSERALAKFASQFAGEAITAMDDLGQAAVAEFLNLHNGIFLVNMSNQGTELTLAPQQIEPRPLAVTPAAHMFKLHVLGEELALMVLSR